jgi:glyoxylase-like metal-dependent hydrolase (beta-lactamase superfamily II)
MKIWTKKSRFHLLWILCFAFAFACSPPRAEQGAPLADGRIHTAVFDPAGSTAYLVKLADGGAIWIDTGIEPDGALLRSTMSEAGVEEADLLGIFFTHGHGDHVTGALAFPDVPVYAMAAEAPLVAGEIAPERPLPSGEPEATGIQVSNVLEGDSVTELSGTAIESFLIPGHTDGSAAYVVHGVLFLGDAATRTGDGKIDGATWLFSKDPDASKESLRGLGEKLAGRDDIHTLAFGHSAALEDGLPVFLSWLGVEE